MVNFHAPTRFQEVGIFLCIQRYISDGYLVSVAAWKMVARKRDSPSADAVCQRANSVSSSGEYSVTVGCQWPEHKPKIVSPLHRRSSFLAWLLSVGLYHPHSHARSLVRRGRNTWVSPVANARVNKLLSTSRIPSIEPKIRFLDPVRFVVQFDRSHLKLEWKPFLPIVTIDRSINRWFRSTVTLVLFQERNSRFEFS